MSRLQLKLLIAVGLMAAMEFLWAHPHHPVFLWHRIPGYSILLGFASGYALLKLSKVASKKWLAKNDENSIKGDL